MHVKENYFVLTGASGSGKSTLLEALSELGYLCVPESGRQVVRKEIASGSTGTPWQDARRFMELVLARNLRNFAEVTESLQPVFFDRGIPECLGEALLLGEEPAEHRMSASLSFRYNRRVFVTPPWPEIFANDAERRHSFDEALRHYRGDLLAYTRCGYELIEVPQGPVDSRVSFILEQVGSARP